ncbi:MAG: L-aspartate oxidase [Candidatus Heimdallarchaeota archaeon]|nr:MAG: L-aspartate oxidase [Candidatus Heimdallarchaeota archaeon]
MDADNTEVRCDVLIIGSGIAGLSLALKVASFGKVIVLSKGRLSNCATNLAQAGIAAALSSKDSFSAHGQDTTIVGDGLCHPKVVQQIISTAPSSIQELIEYGVIFSKNEDGSFDFGLEAGHSHRRILHSGDITGAAIHKALCIAANNESEIILLEDHIAINLKVQAGRCLGAYVLNKTRDQVKNFSARVTVLATGGLGKAFLYTSNPDGASGDGIAMAYRAGATIMNMEFIQFHPTLLYHPFAKSFLISEALRGEGAQLIDHNGNRFMEAHDSRLELAPRDIVARAIDAELKRTGVDHLFLDISFKDPTFIKNRFPGIYEKCLSHGIDITKEPIPIVPAAHYAIGGVKTTVSGVTDIPGLLAIGETACTGFHGANRLASNSLLEASVMAHFGAQECRHILQKEKPILSFSPWHSGDAVDSDESVVVSQNWMELRLLMWNYVGIVRSDKRLRRAKRRIILLQDEINQYYWDFKLTSDLIELRNLADVAQMIIDSAFHRKESRGVHYTVDYPQKLANSAKDTLIRKSVLSDVTNWSERLTKF